MGTASDMFSFGIMEENYVENADETHVIINLDNGWKVGFCGESEIKKADVIIGGAGFTMLVGITGRRDAIIT